MATLQFDEDLVQPKQTNAFIVNFTNGKLKNTPGKELNFGYFESIKTASKKKILVGESDRVQYLGNNDQNQSDPAKYYVLLRNKKTNKVQVLGTEQFCLRPYANEAGEPFLEDEDEVDAGSKMSYSQKSDQLTGAFGSSKKRRAMESRLRNTVGGQALETAVESAVNHAFSQSDSKNLFNPEKGGDAASVIPPHDPIASIPEDAYKLNDLVTPAVIEALQTLGTELAKADKATLQHWRTNKMYSSFVMHQLSCLPVNEQQRLDKSCCLLYLHHLISLFNLKVKDLKRKDFIPLELPELVRKDFIEKFTVSVAGPRGMLTRAIPPRLKDKLASYILVISLILENFNLEFTPLISDLSLGKERMMTYLKAIGCKVNISKLGTGDASIQMKLATLPVPLKFPDIKRQKTKKERR